MAKQLAVAGSTGNILLVYLEKLNGSGKTGLGIPDAVVYYTSGTSAVPVTLSSVAVLGQYISGGFAEVDSAGMPGVYEFHAPNAAFASSAPPAFLFVPASPGTFAPVAFEVQLRQARVGGGVGGGIFAGPLPIRLQGDGVGTGAIFSQVFQGDGISSNIVSIAAIVPVVFRGDGVGTGVWLGNIKPVNGPGTLPAGGGQVWNFGF